MDTKIEKKIPALIEPDFLLELFKEDDFEEKYRLLEANLGDSSYPDYEKYHIKNAIYFNTMICFEPTKYLPRDWPNPEEYAKYLGGLGISNEHHIIIYDRSLNGFASSARAWMHLRTMGYTNASILKGGLTLWMKKNFDVTDEIKKFSAEEFLINENPSLRLNYDDILNVLESKSHQLIDTRPKEDFEKENSLLGKNHLDDAKNFPYQNLFDPHTGTIKDENELKEMLKSVDIDLSQPTVLYCHTSFTASSVAFSFFILGFENIPIYKGSWNEYSLRKLEELEKQNESKPIENN